MIKKLQKLAEEVLISISSYISILYIGAVQSVQISAQISRFYSRKGWLEHVILEPVIASSTGEKALTQGSISIGMERRFAFLAAKESRWGLSRISNVQCERGLV